MAEASGDLKMTILLNVTIVLIMKLIEQVFNLCLIFTWSSVRYCGIVGIIQKQSREPALRKLLISLEVGGGEAFARLASLGGVS